MPIGEIENWSWSILSCEQILGYVWSSMGTQEAKMCLLGRFCIQVVKCNEFEFLLVPVGVLTFRPRMLDGSGHPPIDMSGNCLLHMWAKSPSNKSHNLTLWMEPTISACMCMYVRTKCVRKQLTNLKQEPKPHEARQFRIAQCYKRLSSNCNSETGWQFFPFSICCFN